MELNNLKSEEETEAFIKRYCKWRDAVLFYKYFGRIVYGKKIDMSRVITDSRINKNYVYNIVNGKKLNPGRDKVIALCLGAHLTLDETDLSLEICGHCRLIIESERDVRIAVFINNKKYSKYLFSLIVQYLIKGLIQRLLCFSYLLF